MSSRSFTQKDRHISTGRSEIESPRCSSASSLNSDTDPQVGVQHRDDTADIADHHAVTVIMPASGSASTELLPTPKVAWREAHLSDHSDPPVTACSINRSLSTVTLAAEPLSSNPKPKIQRKDIAAERIFPDPSVTIASTLVPDPKKRKSTEAAAKLLPDPKKRKSTAMELRQPDPSVSRKRTGTAAELHHDIGILDPTITDTKRKKMMIALPYPTIHTRDMDIILYVGELKGLYTSLAATQTSEIQWPPPCTHRVFNLAMIKKEQVQRGDIDTDSYIRMTITGKLDDILHMKVPIQLENIFAGVQPNKRKVVLMEGAPGCGKSTLANFISQQWGEDKLFTEFKVVVLIRLRDPVIQKAHSILDLIPSGDDITLAQKAEESMRASNFEDVLFILDGWDELPNNLREDSIFRKLIQDDQIVKHGLHNSAVIVTSRPVVSGDLHKIVSTRIEILGFTPRELENYFCECLGGDFEAVRTLQDHIQENPEMAGICYLPLNASILAHLFKSRLDKSLPTSQYGIFSLLVCTCISRHLRDRTLHRNLTLETLDQLVHTEIIKEPFRFLCSLAYDGVMTDRITFSSLPDNTNTLSILHGVESFVKYANKVRSYNFVHLSIQELLAAFYMTKWLPLEEQITRFNELFDNPRFSAVFQFYSAMTKLQTPGISDILTKVAEQCSDQSPDNKLKILLVTLFHCLNAAQDPNLCELVMKHLQHGVNLGHITLNPTDCLCIGYFLSCACNASTSTSKFKAKLFGCNIGDTGCKYLVKGLQTCLTTTGHTATCLYVDLKWNNIREKGSNELSKLLQFDCINGMNLNGNEELSDQGTFHITKELKSNTSLTELQLYTCGLTAEGIYYIAEAIKINKSLTLLNIGGNGIYDEGIKSLAEALKVNHCLESLELSSCGMTDAGLKHIISSLLHNESLKELRLYNFQNQFHLNVIKDRDYIIKYLIDNLRKNLTLASLVLPADFEVFTATIQEDINEARKLQNAPIQVTG